MRSGIYAGSPSGSGVKRQRLIDSNPSGLLERIEAFELDDPKAQLPFTSRLAREQGWSHAFAGRVSVEYKRFIALAVLAGHPVSPSEAVDQVWHLHLVYTKSYWKDLCRDVLDREIHHSPTTGGHEEGEKFADWYSRTLESYHRVFGEEPPADIWTAPEEHLKHAGAERWIDTSTFWLIPRPVLFRKGWWRGLLSKNRFSHE